MLGSQARSAEQPPRRGADTETTQVEHELCLCLAKTELQLRRVCAYWCSSNALEVVVHRR